MLSALISIYDPLGIGTPFLLKEKHNSNALCTKSLNRDGNASHDMRDDRKARINKLNLLKNIQITKWFQAPKSGNIGDSLFF